MRYRIPPRLSGKPYSRVRLEFSPDKGFRDLSPPKLPNYLRSIFLQGIHRASGSVSQSAACWHLMNRSATAL